MCKTSKAGTSLFGMGAVALLFVLILAPAGGAEIQFQAGNLPDAEYSQNAATVWSQWPKSTSKNKGDLFVGVNEPGYVMRGLLDFDISDLPEGAIIESISLRFYQAPEKPAVDREVTVELHSLEHGLREGRVTWSDPDGDGNPGDGSDDGGGLDTLLQTVQANPSLAREKIIPSSEAFVVAAQAALEGDGRLNLALKLQDEDQEERCLWIVRGNEYRAAKSRPLLTLRYWMPAEPIVETEAAKPQAAGTRLAQAEPLNVAALELPRTNRLTLVNYSDQPVFATAVSLRAELLYQRSGLNPGTPLEARGLDGSVVPLYPATQDGQDVLRVYVSLRPGEKRVLELAEAETWPARDALVSAEMDPNTAIGQIGNGLLRMDYSGRSWSLSFAGPESERIDSVKDRELVRDCTMDLWLDRKNRGRLLDYSPDDLYELDMLHTSDAQLVDATAEVNEIGSLSLRLVRKFEGFASGVTWTQTYTLPAGLPELRLETRFELSEGSAPLYLAYVNQGSGLAGDYGALLRERPLFKYVDPADSAALIAGGKSSPLIRVSWRNERCWVGFSAPNGAGLGISTTAETKELDRGSTVWNINHSGFRITLIEEEQKHFPFEFGSEQPFVNGLALLGTSGGVNAWEQTRNLFRSEASGEPLELLHAYAVFLGDEPLQAGYVNKRLAGTEALLETGEGRRLAALRLGPKADYVLKARAAGQVNQDIFVAALDGRKNVDLVELGAGEERTVSLTEAIPEAMRKGMVLMAGGELDRFSVEQAPMQAPVLSTPRDGQDVTDFAVFFRWKKVPGAIDYELQWARNKGFDEAESRRIQLETALPFYMPDDDELPEPGVWYWRVRAMDGEKGGAWSDARQMAVNDDHGRKPLAVHITPQKPLFTYEGQRVPRDKVANFRDIIDPGLRPHVAYVMTPPDEEELSRKENLVEYFAPLAGSDMQLFTRSLHPGTMAEHFGSLSELEALFQHNPNIIGDQGGEAMSVLYRGGATQTYSHRLIRLCAKYGKLFYMADGTYPMDNKWEDMYAKVGEFLEEYKEYIAFAQKNNILQRQMLSQSSVLGLYLSDAITNQGAWEDGGWYWQQVGFQELGELYGRRGGDVRTMPRIFWALNFVMGISRGTAIFSLDGQTGTAPPMDENLRDIDKPLAGSPHAFWTRDGQILPTHERFIEPLLRAIVEHDLVPTKEQVLANIQLAVFNDGIEATEQQEPYYRQFHGLYAGTYGFKPMLDYPGELYEFFPNTGRYYYIPVFPQGKVDLGPQIQELPLSGLMDQQKVREVFNAAYPEWYGGDALVSLVGDTFTALNSNENLDELQSYRVPLEARGVFQAIEGEVEVHSYLVGKFEDDNQRLWLQANTEYPERETRLRLRCLREPRVEVVPQEATIESRWDAGTGELALLLSHAEGAVEITLD